MLIVKSLECNCKLEKITGISKKGNPYTAYRVSFPGMNIPSVFIDTYNKNGSKLAFAVDLLGDPPASDNTINKN